MKLTKQILGIVALGAMALTQTACQSDSDFLKEHSYKQDDSGMFNSENEVAMAINSCYKEVNYLVLGLTGADMDVIHSHKRPLKDGIDFGFVGDVERANGKMLQTLINEGITPVMAPLTHDGKGNILNTNADTIASETAKALAPYYDVTLIYSFEKKGVLSNPEDDDSVIPVITHADFERYKADGTVAGGMIPKLENALAAIDAGVKEVIITLATAIDGKHGTVIKS